MACACGWDGVTVMQHHPRCQMYQEVEPTPDSLQAVLCRVSQLLHGWHQDGTSWSEWDESVYKEVCHWQRYIDGKTVTVGPWRSR